MCVRVLWGGGSLALEHLQPQSAPLAKVTVTLNQNELAKAGVGGL